MNRGFTLIGLIAVFALATAGQAIEINFDTTADGHTTILAHDVFGEVLPSSTTGPSLDTYSSLGATFTGGVILTGECFDNPSNLLATSDFAMLKNNARLPGRITIQFAHAVNSVSLSVINGFEAANFTITADTGQQNNIHLNSFTNSGDMNTLSVSGPVIHSVTISTDQLIGNKSFGIDNLQAAPVPEPATYVSVIGSLVLLHNRMKKSK
jgi:hypothetical protein